jgi:hypothetical protein
MEANFSIRCFGWAEGVSAGPKRLINSAMVVFGFT